jgi:tRNA pseudouridine38-40 synthase
MRTIKLTLAYDGTDYAGWQAQPDAKTLQGTLEAAIGKVTGETVRVLASGRTDAGVHALGQVVSFSTGSELSADVLQRAITNNLPRDMVVLEVVEAPEGFNALRDTVLKRYRYQLDDGPAPNPLERHQVWHFGRPLNVEAMKQGAELLRGTKDFASFQSSGAPRESTWRTISGLAVARSEDEPHRITIDIVADGFLYNMVRAIVGTLIEVGLGNHEAAWVEEVLKAKDRGRGGRTAPAHGLCLMRAYYRDENEPIGRSHLKTPQQIIAAIEQYYAWSTEPERAKFYYSDPWCMEGTLYLLESIYEYIIDDSELHFGTSRGFIDYSTAQGYGALGFCFGQVDDDDEDDESPSVERLRRPPLSDAELKKMDELAAFWREYLASSFRKHPTDG